MFPNVLVGVDEGPGGRDAIALATNLVAKDGKLALGYVYPGDHRMVPGSSPAHEAVEQARSRVLLNTRTCEGLDRSRALVDGIVVGWAWPARAR